MNGRPLLGQAETEIEPKSQRAYLFYWPEHGVAVWANPWLEGQNDRVAQERLVTKICIARTSPVQSLCGPRRLEFNNLSYSEALEGLSVASIEGSYRRGTRDEQGNMEFTNARVPYFAKHVLIVEDAQSVDEVVFLLNGYAFERRLW